MDGRAEGTPVFTEGSIRGSWPGGPKRETEAPKRTRPPRLQRVEEIERRIARRSVRMHRKSRLRRLGAVWLVSTTLALGAGAMLGLLNRASAEDLTAAQEAARGRDLDISSEINRTLLELWRMEDLEYARNRRR